MVFKKENKIHHECPYLGSVCSWKLEESKVSKKRGRTQRCIRILSEHTDMSKPEVMLMNGEVPNITAAQDFFASVPDGCFNLVYMSILEKRNH